MKVSAEGVTIRGELHEWDYVYEMTEGVRKVYKRVGESKFKEMEASVGNIVLRVAESENFRPFNDAIPLRRIMYDEASGNYTGVEIGRLYITDEGHLRRSVVISSHGRIIEGVISPYSDSLNITIFRITSINETMVIHPSWIELTFKGEDRHENTIQEILSMDMSLPGEAVDIEDILFTGMTRDQIIEEYFRMMDIDTDSVKIDALAGTISVGSNVIEYEVVLKVARGYILELYSEILFHQLQHWVTYINEKYQ